MNPAGGHGGIRPKKNAADSLRPLIFPLLALSAFLPAACASGPELPSPSPGFAQAGLPGDWLPDPMTASSGVAFMTKDGIPAVKVDSTAGHAFAGRRLDSPLMAAPYLRWAWYLETTLSNANIPHLSSAAAAAGNPLRLRVGFLGGRPEKENASSAPWTAVGVPPHDRLVDLVWEWQTTDPPHGDDAIGLRPGCTVPCVAFRKEYEDVGQWRLEAADLESIYRRFWPEDRLAEARVVFIAFLPAPSPMPLAGYLADLDLGR